MWAEIKKWFNFLDSKVTAEDLEIAKAISDKNIKEANETINKAKPKRTRKKK